MNETNRNILQWKGMYNNKTIAILYTRMCSNFSHLQPSLN